MCLAIPGQIVEIVDEPNPLAKVEVAGVRRTVNIGLLDGVGPGDWVLIHVGFALSKIDEEEAHATLRAARGDGRGVRAGARGAEGERDRVTRLTPLDRSRTCITCGDEAIPMRVAADRRARAALALCCEADGAASARSVEIALVERRWRPASALLVHAGRRARQHASAGGARVKFVDEFRDAELGRALAGEILAAVEPGRHYKIMEVCGGHTHSIYKYGVDDLLPANVELVHGPGCPVCVIPMGRVDDGIALAARARRDLHLLRRHGARARLAAARCSTPRPQGADVRMVYSPLDALRIAKQNPDREVVFFAIGFETTAPSTALTLRRAKAESVDELLGHVHPRDDRPAAARAAGVARPAPRRLHRPRPRLHGRRRAAVPVHPRPTTASRWRSPASSRSTSCRRS